MSAIQRFKRGCLALDGNTKLKSKTGHYGNDSSIVSNAVQFGDRKFRGRKVHCVKWLAYINCLVTYRNPLSSSAGQDAMIAL